MTDVWINYNAVVHLPRAMGYFKVKQVNLKCIFYFNAQS